MTASFRLPKLVLVGASILAMVMALFFSPFQHKAEASVSWGQEVTEVAKRFIGVKYAAGGTTPKGFDASGFTKYIFKESAAKINLPRTSKEQYKVGTAVNRQDIREGDLVFFKTNGKDVSFVGIALNNESFIAVTVNKGVSIQSLKTKYWKDCYFGAKRVLNN